MNGSHKITIDRDPQYAPCCLIICRVDPQDHSYNTRDEDATVLIQSDFEWPAVARTFGWAEPMDVPEEELVPLAGEFLDKSLGRIVDDPGYFP